MSRIVDIEQLGCLAWQDGEHGTTFDDGVLWVLEKIDELPTIEPQHKTGKWIKKMLVTETEKYISYDPEWYCSCCGAKYDSHIAKIVNFCYVCGADMRGEKKE